LLSKEKEKPRVNKWFLSNHGGGVTRWYPELAMNLQDDLEQRSTTTPDGKENGYSPMTPTLGPNKNTRKLS
jgi:hypothetical protein